MDKKGDVLDLMHTFVVFLFGTLLFLGIGYLMIYWLSSGSASGYAVGEGGYEGNKTLSYVFILAVLFSFVFVVYNRSRRKKKGKKR